MLKILRINNDNFGFISITRVVFPLLAIVICSHISLPQTHPTGGKGVALDENEELKKKVEQFLLLDESHPMTRNSHIYYNITAEILPHNGLLSLAEKVVTKGIKINTVENLRKAYPDRSESSIKHQQRLEFGRLYSQYAWILWKKGQTKNAFDTMTKARNYILSLIPEDCLRLGIIEYGNGRKEQGWNHVTEALMKDSIVEEQEPGYRRAIEKIVKDKFGKEKKTTAFIAEYRRRNVQMIPNLSLRTLESSAIDTRRFQGKVTFVNFFSPVCNSCRQEIPSLKDLYKQFFPKANVIFILNQPDLKQEAIALFEKSGIHKPIIAVLEKGSVWDLISAEPSIWITDKAGKVVFRHSGYKRGDESIYERILQELITN